MARTDYVRIERAINYLDGNTGRHPALREVADHVGLSEYHFQRLFTRWAGISPKRFLQFQTVAHARELLRDSRSLLEASWDAGLSGPGRLHDLFVNVEAVTPGEYRAGGADLVIHHGVHSTPFGCAFVAVTERGVAGLEFLPDGDESDALETLRERWPLAVFKRDTRITRPVAERIFAARLGTGSPPLGVLLKGTNFQLKVWEALLRIPVGAVATYEDVARLAGDPSAVRAAASAVARNPVAFLIPCHRVIRKTGAFGDYHWGAVRKRAILTWEAGRAGNGEQGTGSAHGAVALEEPQKQALAPAGALVQSVRQARRQHAGVGHKIDHVTGLDR